MRQIHWFIQAVAALALALVATASLAQGLEGPGRITIPQDLDLPITVEVGIQIEQITFVDQKSENYGAVATFRLRWQEPKLAFDESEFGRPLRVVDTETFLEIARENEILIPRFVVQNQQGKRWIQQSVLTIRSNGEVRYFEHSSLTLQAPDFDFKRYPFDHQKFYLRLVSIFPPDAVRYVPLDEVSGLGDQLGEEEWILEKSRMLADQSVGLSGEESDRVSLAFEGRRHVMYYALRIFLPMLILIVVSWSVFFLEEYRKRIEIAGANLLVFVAFNWAISADLPKLGYLTFLDFILQCMFVMTGAIVVINVFLRRLKVDGKEALAARLDRYVIKWIYPLGYAAIVAFAVARYLLG